MVEMVNGLPKQDYEKLQEILQKPIHELSEFDKNFLKARRSYLNPIQLEAYASILGQEEAKKNDSENNTPASTLNASQPEDAQANNDSSKDVQSDTNQEVKPTDPDESKDVQARPDESQAKEQKEEEKPDETVNQGQDNEYAGSGDADPDSTTNQTTQE